MIFFNVSRSATKLVASFVVATMALSTFSLVATADQLDTFNLNVGSNYTHDSNLFRLPDGVSPQGSGAQRSDNILRNNVGFSVNKKYSLQTFQLDFTHTENKYDNASYLNFNSNAYKAAWLWALTPYLTGTLSSERTEALVPFMDFRNTNAQNIRTNETQTFDFDWSAHGNWHLIGRLRRLDQVNTRTFLPETSYQLDSLEGGVKYVLPSQSYLSFMVRDSKGENQAINPNFLVGRSFDEKQAELKALWILSGKSKLTSNFGRLSRYDDNFTVRDFSDYFGGLIYSWDATGKTNVTMSLTRVVSSFQDVTSSYTSNDSFSIVPSWAATSKITVRANFLLSKRKFLGDGPTISPIQREDDGETYGIGVDWAPRSTIRFGLNLSHDRRDSNAILVNGIDRDYIANTASISGQLNF